MTEDRARLLVIIDDIADAARARILDPKNVAKGDGWRGYSWEYLDERREAEYFEFLQELIIPHANGRRLAEAGDELVYKAMMLDKATADEEKEAC